MANKYLEIDANGRKAEVEVNTTSAGAGDSGKLIGLDATGRIDTTMMPVGIGADTSDIVCSENLSAGDFINIYDDAGTIKVRKADATSVSKRADGFVLSSYTSGATATVYFEGRNTQLTGLTIGERYFLSDSVAGGVTTTPPTTSAYIVQVLGKAISTTSMTTEIAEPVIRA